MWQRCHKRGRLEAVHLIVMEITFVDHGKIMELFLNFCGNPDGTVFNAIKKQAVNI